MNVQDYAMHVEQLKMFLAMAPTNWTDTTKRLKKFCLPTNEVVSCIFWNDLFFITGTDIMKILTFRFQAIGRPVRNIKKFEEGVFSDLRNLKPGQDASLEEPRSKFLEFLYKNNCIRTQKKQKVFYWYSVPHDRIFLDALERDLRRESMGQETSTVRVPHFIVPEGHASLNVSDFSQVPPPMDDSSQPMPQLPPSSMKFPPLQHVTEHRPSIPEPAFNNESEVSIRSLTSHANESFPDLVGAGDDVNSPPTTSGHLDLFKPHMQPSPLITPLSAEITPNLIPIAPKSDRASTAPSSCFPLEGSSNYKKQRRRSSIYRMSNSKPYNLARRFTQPDIASSNNTQASGIPQTSLIPPIRTRSALEIVPSPPLPAMTQSPILETPAPQKHSISDLNSFMNAENSRFAIRSNSVSTVLTDGFDSAEFLQSYMGNDETDCTSDAHDIEDRHVDLDLSSFNLDTSSFSQMMGDLEGSQLPAF